MPREPFISFAQNFEDVVLWRALGHIEAGIYVDVGAAHPVHDSLTKVFYDRGWRGLNIEPVAELAQALREARPEDTTVAAAAGASNGEVVLHALLGTGLSTLVDDEAERAHGLGHDVEDRPVHVRRLDDVLTEAGFEGRSIHLCKIDVEGFEAEVLAGLDLRRWQPWVLVIESTKPNSRLQTHDVWEPEVLEAGYEFCLFDGLNRFYVAEEHAELRDLLSSPASVLDMPFMRAPEHDQRERLKGMVDRLNGDVRNAIGRTQTALEEANKWRKRTDEARRDSISWRTMALRSDFAARHWAREAAIVGTELAAVRDTVSWRVTAPLRRARTSQGKLTSAGSRLWDRVVAPAAARGRSSTEDTAPYTARAELDATSPGLEWSADEQALAGRLSRAAAVLAPKVSPPDAVDPPSGLLAIQEALAATDVQRPAATWLTWVAFHGAYPSEAELERAQRVRMLGGPAALVNALLGDARQRIAAGTASLKRLEVVEDGVVADVSHTASHHLHTGVQRVVRETVSRWLDNQPLVLVAWDYASLGPSPLTAEEVARFQSWRDHLQVGGERELIRLPECENAVVVPWRSVYLLPEIAGEPQRTEGYRALARAGVATRLSAICYDLIPVTIRETVINGLAEAFTDYLMVVKYCDRVSAISQSCANEFQAFGHMMASQGLRSPKVVGHTLPTEAPDVTDDTLDETRHLLHLDSAPVVLVVGSHEPRKNHVAVLLAAERLWRAGHPFHLVFIGGSAWKSEPFNEFVAELQQAGRPIEIVRRASEETLWGAYRLARFSVFPSLAEGYGLPVAESLVSGTPVIASDYGSLAEIAEGGGAIAIDPRDPEALHQAMHELLVDDDLVAQLRQQALGRPWKSWDEYAKETWDHLVGG